MIAFVLSTIVLCVLGQGIGKYYYIHPASSTDCTDGAIQFVDLSHMFDACVDMSKFDTGRRYLPMMEKFDEFFPGLSEIERRAAGSGSMSYSCTGSNYTLKVFTSADCSGDAAQTQTSDLTAYSCSDLGQGMKMTATCTAPSKAILANMAAIHAYYPPASSAVERCDDSLLLAIYGYKITSCYDVDYTGQGSYKVECSSSSVSVSDYTSDDCSGTANNPYTITKTCATISDDTEENGMDGKLMTCDLASVQGGDGSGDGNVLRLSKLAVVAVVMLVGTLAV